MSGSWEHEKCAVCSVPIAGRKHSCTQCPKYNVCEECFIKPGSKAVSPHSHKHPMVNFHMTEAGLPYVILSSLHEHALTEFSTPPSNVSCDSCKNGLKKEERVHSCRQEGCNFDICENCLKKTALFSTTFAREQHEAVSALSKNNANENGQILAIVQRLAEHTHELERYPKSPYKENYACDSCKNSFDGVVYHCISCGNYDICPACFAENDGKKEQQQNQITEKKDLVALLNLLLSQEPAKKYDSKKPGPDDEVHYTISCDGCGVKNVVGNLYECLVCNVTLCGPCLDKNSSPYAKIKHQAHHPMERKRAPCVLTNPGTLFHPVSCDTCNQRILGTRYRCIECPKFNWCETCNKKKVVTPTHDLFHTMQILLGPGETRQMIQKPCKACHSSENYGAMLKCNVCVNYHLCKYCFLQGNSAEHHKVVHSVSYVVAGQDDFVKPKKEYPVLQVPILLSNETTEGTLEACKDDVKAIIAKCKASGPHAKYTDTSFPANDECLFVDPKNPPADWIKPTQYLRITEICSNPILFSSGITADDVDQGAIGTCYLLGDLSGIAKYPHLISQLFVEWDIQVGVYGIRFFINSRWVYVIIDDYIPCNENRRPVYGCCTERNELWVMLIEKAYAKLHSCYENINGGLERLAFSDLTGGVAQRVVIAAGLRVNPNGTTLSDPPPSKEYSLVDDSLSGAARAGFSTSTFGSWRGIMNFHTDTENLELVMAFSSGCVVGGGKSHTTGKQYNLEGSTDAITQFVWFKLTEVVYLPHERPKPIIFFGLYNSDSLSMRGEWLEFTSGAIGTFILVEQVDPNVDIANRIGPFSSIWEILTLKHKDHVLMSCSIDDPNAAPEEKTHFNLLKNHAYSVISFLKLDKDLLLVKIRNPHGHAGWKGKWEKGSKDWTTERIRQVPDYDPKENGEFYMEFPTFLSLFNSVDMCRLFTNEWNMQVRDCEFTPTMCGGDSFWLENPQIRIMPQVRGKFVISVSQPNVKIYSGVDLYPIPIGFRIVYLPYPTDRVREYTGYLVVCHVPATTERTVSIEIELDALEHPYYVIPYTKEPGKHLPFQVCVYSTAVFDMSDMSFMDDPSCQLIPSGEWQGMLLDINTQELIKQMEPMNLYFDASRSVINGVGTDKVGKYFVLGKYKWGDEEKIEMEFQVNYLQLRDGEEEQSPTYGYGAFWKEQNAFIGYWISDGTAQNALIHLAPVERITPPSGYYEGTLTMPQGEATCTINHLIFKNNLVYGSDFSTTPEMTFYSIYGEINPTKREVIMCQMEHQGPEFMYFGQISDDLLSISGELRGVQKGYGLIQGEFVLQYNADKTKQLTEEEKQSSDDEEPLDVLDPTADWYFNHRLYEIVEYFSLPDDPKATKKDKEDRQNLLKEISQLLTTKKHYIDRIDRHTSTTSTQGGAQAQPNITERYSRKEMAKFGRNEMSRFGRSEMARHMGRNEMARHMGRKENARHMGRNEMARHGRKEMARYGRKEMARFGRKEMSRFGRHEMSRFGRKEMSRFGRKQRDYAEYEKREKENAMNRPQPQQQIKLDVEADVESLLKQIKNLEFQLQEQRQKTITSPETPTSMRSPSKLRGVSSHNVESKLQEYELLLQKERENVKLLEEKVFQLEGKLLAPQRDTLWNQVLGSKNSSPPPVKAGASKVYLPKLDK